MRSLNNLFACRLYQFQQTFLGPTGDNEFEPLTCNWCYRTVCFPEDSIKIISRKRAIKIGLIKTNEVKHKVVIQSCCHSCGKCSTTLLDKAPTKIESLTKKQVIERKKAKDNQKNKEEKESKPKKFKSNSPPNEDTFRKNLVKQIKKKSKTESQITQEARSSLLSFLKQVD
ncbi:hypothetical protein EDI_240740 [Entamoeba dispar SAW760]|uniref:Uncharacterized protein n=1 Tax=Entamoeba dispar (strain ATCC PRA-260 / SAW760) TaxID=370354 RepID=B0ERC5_ENTDS|nr:uncharacterized protein EDI_240740 [Entamoeba dispar SAW760]EDR22916.1 hypothetical protein EDI_240740 [Entamoeba dispar SAW760]|eukprot:EDR22916.1 hypothetical protein EDI_240740 [Entamoeba dispar SAW760]